MTVAPGDEVRVQLAAALGANYVLERELGGGGMSRVFVVRDEALGREVVVKVLTPELAQGLSAERFAREIRLAAALQEPHLVPVLTAGVTASGLPYYTMPFVRGESLRHRLARGAIPRAESLTILRDVAMALEYAHSQGVIHRDIKPENVLLSGRTAMVTDFGIARALSSARTTAGSGTSSDRPASHVTLRASPLTGVGISLGTPAYMAPEQAAGDQTDARSDLYSWGIMAYEVLAGAHPFAGKTSAQQLIAAHILEEPAPLESKQRQIARGLAALVTQCLSKDPAKRPDSAAALVAALEGGAVVSTGGRRVNKRRWRRIASIAGVAVMALLAVGYMLVPPELKATVRTIVTRPPPDYRVNSVVVAPLENETGDASLAPLGAMAADMITEALSRVSSLEVVDVRTAAVTGEIVSAIPRLLRGADAARALAAETESRVLVTGSYFREGDTITFRTKVLDAATGRVLQVLPLVPVPARTPTRNLPALAQRVAASLRGASDPQVAASLATFSSAPSMAAFEATRAAFIAYFKQDTARVTLARRAVALDSTYGFALVLLPWVAASDNQFGLADSSIALAHRFAERLSPVEQSFVDLLATVGLQASIDAAERTLRLAPRSTEAALALAAYLLMARQPKHALRVLDRLDPKRGILLFTEQYWGVRANIFVENGDLDRALSAVEEGQRQFGANGPFRSQEASIKAILGDAGGATHALEQITGVRTSFRPMAAAGAAARLRSLPARERTAREFAAHWIARTSAEHDTSRVAADGRLDLLAAADRWTGVLALADSLQMSEESIQDPQTHLVRSARAVALIHVGRRAEALAVDSQLVASGSPFWAQGAVQAARARIAAHLGDARSAVALLGQAEALGYQDMHGLTTLDGDPLLLPLRGNPAFVALLRPSPEDAR